MLNVDCWIRENKQNQCSDTWRYFNLIIGGCNRSIFDDVKVVQIWQRNCSISPMYPMLNQSPNFLKVWNNTWNDSTDFAGSKMERRDGIHFRLLSWSTLLKPAISKLFCLNGIISLCRIDLLIIAFVSSANDCDGTTKDVWIDWKSFSNFDIRKIHSAMWPCKLNNLVTESWPDSYAFTISIVVISRRIDGFSGASVMCPL